MARKVYIEAKVKLVINMEDDVTVEDALSDVVFSLENENADLVDSTILSHEIKDSK